MWYTDITYVQMPGGQAHLCPVIDWHSRRVLGWALFNTMEAVLCLEALEMALASSGGRLPEILNTHQGAQFAGAEWTGRLTDLEARISRDGPSVAGISRPPQRSP